MSSQGVSNCQITVATGLSRPAVDEYLAVTREIETGEAMDLVRLHVNSLKVVDNKA